MHDEIITSEGRDPSIHINIVSDRWEVLDESGLVMVSADDKCSRDSLYDALAHYLVSKGYFWIHGATVELWGRSFFILGESRAGKSTLAFRLSALGGVVRGDDAFCCKLHNDELRVIPIPKKPKARGRVPESIRFDSIAFSLEKPSIIIFPRFSLSGEDSLKKLTPSETLMRVLNFALVFKYPHLRDIDPNSIFQFGVWLSKNSLSHELDYSDELVLNRLENNLSVCIIE